MKIRSFLAFPIPKPVTDKISHLVSLMQPLTSEVIWVKPEHYHCTIKFFGEIEEQILMENMIPTIQRILEDRPPLSLQAVGFGVFPNWRYPQVFWAGLLGDTDALLTLHTVLEKAFISLGVPEDERSFRIHLTIGRAKGKLKKPKQLTSFLEKQVGTEFGEIPVDRLTLYKSVLTPEGPIYTPLQEFEFGKRRII